MYMVVDWWRGGGLFVVVDLDSRMGEMEEGERSVTFCCLGKRGECVGEDRWIYIVCVYVYGIMGREMREIYVERERC